MLWKNGGVTRRYVLRASKSFLRMVQARLAIKTFRLMSGYGVKPPLEWLFRGEANGPPLAGCCLMLRELHFLGSYVPIAAIGDTRKQTLRNGLAQPPAEA